MKRTTLGPKDALLVVDIQMDFCSGGSLGIEDADEVIPVLNDWIKRARQGGAMIIASRDWHPAGHISFKAQGGPWPDHCVQGTQGASFHPDLDLPPSSLVISKGIRKDRDSYSAFPETGLSSILHEAGIENVWIGGLALDYCVKESTRDALAAGFKVFVLTRGTKPVQRAESDRVLEDLAKQGATLVTE